LAETIVVKKFKTEFKNVKNAKNVTRIKKTFVNVVSKTLQIICG